MSENNPEVRVHTQEGKAKLTLERSSQSAATILCRAATLAGRRSHGELLPEHLLAALAYPGRGGASVLADLWRDGQALTLEEFAERVRAALPPVSAEPATGPIMTMMFDGQTVAPFDVNAPRRYGDVADVAADSLE
ncbi:hypothetical protein [Nocardia seriolae]|uniref:Uncharacterized protein n=1 Tax=Nocardia seriolae TaxID=37332 RepID=A0A0B8NL25_9NOCA|nr:hypothetical protein [Nocardia seriolae]APA97535.1 hypothetical protein NS506_03483 [Nocardia seriolae]MTJ62428.1 hypothetical protein [Nocardia seriolae]MTJ74528.1 hypothetical protein [Nocardia seriolae]MTJ87331.1 hypothetical protein [Nocardia seriolae]MTK31325.1 hypothetical protein [Nocardia seriolae]